MIKDCDSTIRAEGGTKLAISARNYAPFLAECRFIPLLDFIVIGIALDGIGLVDKQYETLQIDIQYRVSMVTGGFSRVRV